MATALQQLFGKTSGNALLDKKVKKGEEEAVGMTPQPPAPVAPPKGDLTQAEFGNAKPLSPGQKEARRKALVEALRARGD